MSKVEKAARKIKEGYLKKAFKQVLWIYKVAGEYKTSIFLYSFICIISMLISIFIDVKLKDVVDYIIDGVWNEVLYLLFLYVAIGIVNMILCMSFKRISGVITAKVKRDLSTKLYNKVMASDWEEITSMHSGDLMTRIQEDVANIAGSTAGWVPNICIQGLQAFIALVVIVYFDFSLLIVVVLVAPIIFFGSRIFLGKSYESNQQQRVESSEVMSLYKDSFQNIQAIKAFGLKDYFATKGFESHKKRADADLAANKYSILSWGVMYISGQIAAILCLGWAMYHVYLGYISIGTVVMMYILGTKLASGVKTMFELIPQAVQTITSSERVCAILALEDEITPNVEKALELCVRGIDEGTSVNVENLSFSYKEGGLIFDNVSFTAKAGETIALVGPSGEGKTTMLRILLGLIKRQNGKAYFKIGEECLDISASTRRMIAYVPQGNTMMAGTIADNLRMMRVDATDDEIIEALKKACAFDFVSKLDNGIYHKIGENGGGFSEGQNQRLAIARALLCKTPILLLDEATSALDVKTERMVLKNLMSDHSHRTCILTTHRPSVLNMCDEVYRISNQSITALDEEQINELINEF